MFDGLIDQVGGAGRGSFNHRFGQQSRDQLQHFNILYPVDMFPFTDADQLDPETGLTDGLLARATRSNTVPKFFHVLTDSEYFNRAGSLVHTDVTGTRDVPPPPTSRIYFIASAPHIVGAFPPAPFGDADFNGRASMNPLVYTTGDARAVPRARSLDRRGRRAAAEPLSAARRRHAGCRPMPRAGPRFPATSDHSADDDVSAGLRTGVVEGHRLERAAAESARRSSGACRRWMRPATIAPGIRLPEISVPLATHTGWNYRDASIGAPDRLASEIGSYLPLPRTRADREKTGDGRKSIAERYVSLEDYLGRISLAAIDLVDSNSC